MPPKKKNPSQKVKKDALPSTPPEEQGGGTPQHQGLDMPEFGTPEVVTTEPAKDKILDIDDEETGKGPP